MRILLVEDEEKVARFVKSGLKAELYTVDVAADGRTALEYLKQRAYELAILDLNLPDIYGIEILRFIRSNHGPLPVLILTARDSIADKVANFEHGADDYLTKPFLFTELLLRVKALLRRGQSPSRPDVLELGNLELNRSTHQVKRRGQPIDLTSKEYSLLEYLMTNAGRVLSRTMIIENVWDQSFEGATNIVDIYIAQLRKKIDGSFESKLLRTIRGVGYSLQDEPH